MCSWKYPTVAPAAASAAAAAAAAAAARLPLSQHLAPHPLPLRTARQPLQHLAEADAPLVQVQASAAVRVEQDEHQPHLHVAPPGLHLPHERAPRG